MHFRNLIVLAFILFISACGSNPSPKETPIVPPVVVVAPPAKKTEEPEPTPMPPDKEKAIPVEPTPITPKEQPPEVKQKEKEPPIGKEPKVDPKEPSKEPKFVVPKAVLGRSFDAWRGELKAKDPARREKAMKAILNFGPDKAYEALPDIIGELAKHNKPGPIDLSVRVNGVYAMSTIFFNKKDPDPALVDDAIAVYKTFLKDRQAVLRTRAVQGVLSLRERAQDLINEVIDVAHDPVSSEVRKEGVLALTLLSVDKNKKVHPKAPIELRKALDDASGQVKLAAMQGLSAISPALDDADKKLTVEKINMFLKRKDVDPFLQMTAHVAIMNVHGKVDKANLAPLLKQLKESDELHRAQALQFIKLFGPKAQIAIDDVIELSKNAPTWQMRKEALATAMLLSYDKNGLHPSILPALRNSLGDKSPDVRQTALNGLAAAKDGMGKAEIKTSIDTVNRLLTTEKEPMLEILGHATVITLTGDINESHMQPIVAMIKHKDIAVRLESFRTIGMAGKKAKPFALPAVVEAVRDPDPVIGEAAIDTLPSIHAFESMDMLKKIVVDKKADPAIVEAAQEAIALMEDMLALENATKDKSEKK